MIKPVNRDMNRSRDVAGPALKRPYDKEMEMSKDFGSGLEDYADTGTLSKHPLSELHCGDKEAPLEGLGEQSVVVSAEMGSSQADHKPMIAKGSLKDQAHGGGGKSGSYEEESSSVKGKK